MAENEKYKELFQTFLNEKGTLMLEADQLLMVQGVDVEEERFGRNAVNAVEAYIINTLAEENSLKHTTNELYYLALAYLGETMAHHTGGQWGVDAAGRPAIVGWESKGTPGVLELIPLLRPTFDDFTKGHWNTQVGVYKIKAGTTTTPGEKRTDVTAEESAEERKKAEAALLDLVATGDVEVAKLLIDKGISLAIQNEEGQSLLDIAVKNNQTEMVWLLLESGFKLEGDQKNAALLITATEANNLEMAQQLLKAGIMVDMPWLDKMQIPVARAVELGNEKMVALFVQHGADVNVLNSIGLSPIAMASEEGNRAIVAQLVEAGADVNAMHVDGSTPIARAVYIGNPEALARLIQLGADATLGTIKDQTPMEIAKTRKYSNSDQQKRIINLLQQALNA